MNSSLLAACFQIIFKKTNPNSRVVTASEGSSKPDASVPEPKSPKKETEKKKKKKKKNAGGRGGGTLTSRLKTGI